MERNRITALLTILSAVMICLPTQVSLAQTERPTLRLGDFARPTAYTVELTLRPDTETFPGTVAIDVELSLPLSVMWLHADELEIESASVSFDSRELEATLLSGDDEFLGLSLEEEVGPGTAQLRLSYTGKLPDDEVGGLFRRRLGEDWYIFSQLEASEARRVFPGFDEPQFKVPFELTLTVPEGDLALTNTPLAEQTAGADGMKTLRFRPSQPLPTYLIAVAVGPFEIVDVGEVGRNKTPLRIITPRGMAGQAAYAVESTPPILERLEEYFDSGYPYAKLDQIAVPDFGGAMENPGLVTYGVDLLLSETEEDSLARQRRYALVCAHELAHMWFGDLVTMAWWDDVWLNESFASWMGDRIVRQWQSDWDIDVSMVRRRGRAMRADSLTTARAVRQPVESTHDIANAFDSISYAKGASVLSMFEAWTGEERFRTAVRNYVKEHAHSNATSRDFLKALGLAGGRDVAAAFETFIDQNGVPLVTASLSCDKGRPPVVALNQRRYLPAGARANADQLWQLPICVKYGSGKTSKRECTLMTEAEGRLELQFADRCPDWILPNDGMQGYYRVDYSSETLDELLGSGGRQLSVAERVGLLDDVDALVDAGDLTRAQALSWLPGLLKDRERHVVAISARMVAGLSDDLVPDELRPNYARFISKTYGKLARSLGWSSRANEDEDTRLLRPTLIGLAADEGQDDHLVAEARKLAQRWLKDRSGVDPEMVEVVLRVAARNGDAALWDRFREAAGQAQAEKERRRLLGGLGAFVEPALVQKNLALMTSGEFSVFESAALLYGALNQSETRELAYRFVKENFDAMVDLIPSDFAGMLPRTASRFCDTEHAKDAAEFFGPRVADLEGGPRALEQTLEEIRLCAARREAQLPEVTAFLKSY